MTDDELYRYNEQRNDDEWAFADVEEMERTIRELNDSLPHDEKGALLQEAHEEGLFCEIGLPFLFDNYPRIIWALAGFELARRSFAEMVKEAYYDLPETPEPPTSELADAVRHVLH